MSDTQPHIYDFGDFRIDTGRRLLLRAGQQVLLTPKVFDTLLLLVTHQGQVLDKQHIMTSIWPDTERGGSFVRLSFAGPTSDIEEALRRLGPWLRAQ